jgi:prophage regulatory protein
MRKEKKIFHDLFLGGRHRIAYFACEFQGHGKNSARQLVSAFVNLEPRSTIGFLINQWSPRLTNSKQLLRISEVSDFTSLAKSTINLWVAQGKFPKPLTLSPTIKVWRIQQLHEWVDAHSSVSSDLQVAQSGCINV